jgi:hypothetical protein
MNMNVTIEIKADTTDELIFALNEIKHSIAAGYTASESKIQRTMNITYRFDIKPNPEEANPCRSEK